MGWFFHSAQKVLGTVVNVRVDKWIDFEHLKGTFFFTAQQIRNLFSKNKHVFQAEEFDDAIQRLNLSEEDLIHQYKQYKNLALFFSFLATFVFIYCIYLIYRTNYMGACMAFAITLYGFSQAFRYHFWMFQIKRKKLGCTLKEWWAEVRRQGKLPELPGE